MGSPATGQIISLPQGGGALHGIGETLSPDLHTGTGNFTIPIAILSGRNGFQPQLNLVHSTGNGNGPFGLGWSLIIPGVSRKTSKGIPRYDDDTDIFILSGAEDLVRVPEADSTKRRYRPRTEGLFAEIYHHRDLSTNYWEVRSKDGLVSLYGTPGLAGNDPATIGKPSDPTRLFAWKLTLTTDPFGNRIEYRYERDAVRVDGPHEWDQVYLSEIRYADYGDPADPKFLVTVRFIYEDRPDPFSDYRAGFEVRTIKRCVQIETRTHADAEQLVRTYHLDYLDQRGLPADQLPINGVSLLSQVHVEGHDSGTAEWLPPLEFGYTQFQPEARTFFPLSGPDMPPVSLAHPEYELVDLFGNGLPHILQMNGTMRYWRNMGQGQFNWPHEMDAAPAGLRLDDQGVQLIDANGDGRMDLLVSTATLTGYYPLQFGGLWDRRSFQRSKTAPSFDLKDPEVRLVDLDGDGVTDAIRSSTRLECFFNDPIEGWKETRWVERKKDQEVFPDVNFSDPRVKWADLSGDGLQDIALVYDGIVEYWPSLGRGDWGKRVTMHNCPRFPYGYDPKRILVGDVDGDGLADIVYVDNTKVTLWINQSGNRWSDPIEIPGTPTVSDIDAVRLADILGNGVSGVLWSSDATGMSRGTMFFLDFTGGTKPYLLNEMNNHMGAVTRVGYAPSSQFYLEDEKKLKTRWKTPLPFPVQVVAQVEVIDEISGGKLTTEYSYHHGYWDGVDREFRGFGRVDQRDTETFEAFHGSALHPSDRQFNAVPMEHFSPPTETRSWFHQGPIEVNIGMWDESDFNSEFWTGDSQVLLRSASMTTFMKSLPHRVRRDALRVLRGHILRTELYALDGTERQAFPYTVTEDLYGVREEAAPEPSEGDRLHIFFPHPLAQRTTQWERGTEPMTQFQFTGDYDEYGQPRSQISIAVPRGRDFRVTAVPGEPYLATQKLTTYAKRDDGQRFIVDRIARITEYEIVNDGSPALFALKQAIEAGTAQRRIIGQALSFYDGQPFIGLPFAQLGDFGALVRTETLVLTEDILHEAYRSGSTILTPAEVPPYLSPSGPPAWTAEYPQEFRDLLPALVGYVFQAGGVGSEYIPGYFAVTERRQYGFHTNVEGKGRGLIFVKRNPLGHDTSIAYDRFDLLPDNVTDPVGLMTQASYDYRVLQPSAVIDSNGNQTNYTFTPLGLLESTSVKGKNGEGDQQRPNVVMSYDLLAFASRGRPINVRTVRQVHHDTENDVSQPQRDETIETREYSDGFGRLLQSRIQAEDIIFGNPLSGDAGLNANQSVPNQDAVGHLPCPAGQDGVVVSGWQTYDNKGRVVEKFEPFFSCGWEYAPPTDAARGQKVTMYYDPRGHVIRTVNPDQSMQLVVHGVPSDLTNPDQFTPTPWEAYTYDANDNAGRTNPKDSKSYEHHWNTPTSIVIDALERKTDTIERIRAQPSAGVPLPPVEEYHTRSSYDIRANLLTVKDALGRLAFQHVYDLAKRPLRIENIDAGIRRIVVDAAGNEIERRDSKDALILHAYDILNRPSRSWARDDGTALVTLRELLEYGDSGDPNQSSVNRKANMTANRLGKLYKHYDEAGLLTFENYDFKGNVLEKVRQVIKNDQILSVFGPAAANNWQVQAYRVNWQLPVGLTLANYASDLLDMTLYQTSIRYDALNRVKTMLYPQNVNGTRKELLPSYNRAGALEQVEVDGTMFTERIVYNAKGQRTLIAYGNGVMTRYAYEQKTFRLARIRTEGYTKPSMLTYHPSVTLFQDSAYDHDLIGNILTIHDRSTGSGILNTALGTEALDRTFTYDPLYRLVSATGRECDLPPPPWIDQPRCTDVTKTRGYTERYEDDPLGNVSQLRHEVNGSAFIRVFAQFPGNNRLATVTLGATVYQYAYDNNGNLIQENTDRHFEWDHSDRMRVYRTQVVNAEPSVHVQYLYDASGQRVKKLVRKQGGRIEVTVYIDGIFEHQRVIQNGATHENNTLHVMDHEKRIALLRVGQPFSEDTTPAVKFHLDDHLSSSNLVIDVLGNLINREEYTPYGETSFGSFAKKRYRFTAKERDDESGLYYHGARYYAPWLTRWVCTDPAGMIDGLAPYAYVRNNPLRLTDPTGLNSEIPKPVLDLVGTLTKIYQHFADQLHGTDLSPQVKGTVAGAKTEAFVVRTLGTSQVTAQKPYSSVGTKHSVDLGFEKTPLDAELKWKFDSTRLQQNRVHVDHAAGRIEGSPGGSSRSRVYARVTSEGYNAVNLGAGFSKAEIQQAGRLNVRLARAFKSLVGMASEVSETSTVGGKLSRLGQGLGKIGSGLGKFANTIGNLAIIPWAGSLVKGYKEGHITIPFLPFPTSADTHIVSPDMLFKLFHDGSQWIDPDRDFHLMRREQDRIIDTVTGKVTMERM